MSDISEAAYQMTEKEKERYEIWEATLNKQARLNGKMDTIMIGSDDPAEAAAKALELMKELEEVAQEVKEAGNEYFAAIREANREERRKRSEG